MRNSVIGFTVPQMGPYDFGPFLQDATVVSGYKRLHNGMFNMLFCDGHVEAMRPADLFSAQPEMLRRWDRDNQP
jgi:prepilin-type processing-associated H-X9-DG protein